MINRKITMALFALSLLILSACSTNKGISGDAVTNPSTDASAQKNNPDENVKELVITSFNFGFTQQPVEIKKGDKVRLTLKSTSGVHGIEIPDFGVSSGPTAPGSDTVVEFTATKSGTFNYFCNIPCGPGHMGMQGKIVIN